MAYREWALHITLAATQCQRSPNSSLGSPEILPLRLMVGMSRPASTGSFASGPRPPHQTFGAQYLQEQRLHWSRLLRVQWTIHGEPAGRKRSFRPARIG